MASEDEIRQQIIDLYEAFMRKEITEAEYNFKRNEILRNSFGNQNTINNANNTGNAYNNPNNGTNTYTNTTTDNTGNADKYKGFKMGWHKFLIYFGLWAGAIINAIFGINYITGITYQSEGLDSTQIDNLYRNIDGLKAADVIYGSVLLGLAAFSIIIRFRLAGLKRKAPQMLWILNAISIATGIIFTIIQLNLFKNYIEVNDGFEAIKSLAFPVIISGTAFVINIKYYLERKELSVN